MSTSSRRLLGVPALITLCVLALSGCGGGGSTPTPIVPDDLIHKDVYAITPAPYTSTCVTPGPDYICADIAYPLTDYRSGAEHLNNQAAIVHNYNGPAAYWQGGQNITIGLLGGRIAVSRAVNDAGQIVGGTDTTQVYYAEGDVTHQYPAYGSQAFVWQNGNFNDLGALPSLPNADSEALGVNNSGQIAGWASGATSIHAVVWQNGKIQDLDTGRDTGSLAFAINNSGQAVGINGPTAALWDSGHFTDLGALPNQQGSFAVAINDKVQIVGSSVPRGADVSLGQNARAILWQNGKIQDLGTLGGPTAQAFGINNAGQIVGRADTAQYTLISTVGRGASRSTPTFTARRNLFRYKATASSVPAAMSADPIGTARSYTLHAFLWQNGTMTDLNTLIAANTGWTLVSADGINDKGQIVGFGSYKNEAHYFLLTPR